MSDVVLIVPDASPLITLAAASELDVLLKPGAQVIIPDGVHLETVRDQDKLGSQDIVDWLKRHAEEVRIAPTQEFAEAMLLIRAGKKRVRNLGERCAQEIVNDRIQGPDGGRAVLIYEDSDVNTLSILRPERVGVLTTAEFLDALQAARLIQSADVILDRAVQAGRDENARARNPAANAYARFLQQGGLGR